MMMKNLTKVLVHLSAVSALVAGCSSPMEGGGGFEQEDAAVGTSELKNGKLYDGTAVWNGAVKVEFLNSATK